MTPPRIEVLLDNVELSAPISGALQQLGANVRISRLRDDLPAETATYDARIIVTPCAHGLVNGKLERVLSSVRRSPCATLVVSDDPSSPPPAASPDPAISFASRPTKDALAGRLSAMCAMSRTLNELNAEVDLLRDREQQLSRSVLRLEHDLRAAGNLQRELSRATSPVLRSAELLTWTRASSAVNGDTIRTVRLDDHRVAISIGDATGHGIAAGMMGEFVQNTLFASAHAGGDDLRFHPDRVLRRLNDAIASADLRDCQFVTLIYAVYDETAGIIRWARGGAPYPLLHDPARGMSVLPTDGPIVGATTDATFEIGEARLLPGQTWLAYTDGVEELLGHGPVANGSSRVADWASHRSKGALNDWTLHLDKTVAARGILNDDATVVAINRAARTRSSRSGFVLANA